jgi:thiol-disulfide isomerase/thioredoxin
MESIMQKSSNSILRRIGHLVIGVVTLTGSVIGSTTASAISSTSIDGPSRPTLVFIFQPFCNYCKQAAPFFAQLHAQLGDDMDFVMITDYVGYTADSNSFRSQFGLTMPLIEDANLDFAKYKITGYPNFLWSVPGKGVINWGPVGYNAGSWASRDVPRALRFAKYGSAPSSVTNLVVKVRQGLGQFDASWSGASGQTSISHYEVRVRSGERLSTRVVVDTYGVATTSAAIGVAKVQVDTPYFVSVRAVSPAGEGDWSDERSVLWKEGSATTGAKPGRSVRCRKGSATKVFDAKRCPSGWRQVRT